MPKKAQHALQLIDGGKSDDDDLDAVKAAKRIVDSWDALQAATGNVHDTNVTIRNRNKAAEEKFKLEIEKGIEANNHEQAAMKLIDVTTSWQDWQEAQAEGAEERKAAKEKRAKAVKRFEKSIEESRQLGMFEDK